MRIKQLRINGFKSYKSLEDLAPFDEGVNVIVGQNGSGKSNFFNAIRFLLSEESTNLSSEERQALLHEGAGMAVLSGYVEAVFDNSDGRFPIESAEIVIRRSFGGKKDEYFLDNKHISKSDINNLLETAGFSRSNPYYIVQQGKINALTAMKNSERLELLKEVAGTKVYETKRTNSLKLLAETDGKRKKVDEILEYIDQRLKELEEEEKELRQFTALDRARRTIEYAVHDKELLYTRTKLDELEAERQKLLEKFEELHQQQAKLQEKAREAETDIGAKESQVNGLERECASAEEEREEAVRTRTEIGLDAKDSEEKLVREKTHQKEANEELALLVPEIASAEAELKTASADYDVSSRDEQQTREKLSTAEITLSALHAKQGRKKMFKSQAERDAWINKEIASVKDELKAKQTQTHDLESEIQELSENSERIRKTLGQIKSEVSAKRSAVDSVLKETTSLQAKKDTLTVKRRELWHKQQQLEEQRTIFRDRMQAAERAVHAKMPRVVHNGLNALAKYVSGGKIKGKVYGPLIELMACDSRFYTAVETTAGNSLFHVVVDTDDTASEILNLMSSETKGTSMSARLTFMPLNRLEPKETTAPESQDAVPLLSKLEFSATFMPAFRHVFGKVMLCRNLEVASSLSRQGYDCVTLAGDQVSKRGALTGGYTDVRSSRLLLMGALKETANRLKDVVAELEKIKASVISLDQEISVVSGEISKLQSKQSQARDQEDQLALDVVGFEKELESLRVLIENRNSSLTETRLAVTDLHSRIGSLEDELKSKLGQSLSAAEEAKLHTLTETVTTLRDSLADSTDRRTRAEAKKKTLESKLRDNLTKRRDVLTKTVDGSEISRMEETVKQHKQAQKTVDATYDTITQRIKSLSKSCDTAKEELRTMSAELEKTRAEESDISRQIQDVARDVAKVQSTRAMSLQKCEEHARNVRELGTIPQEEYEKYKGLHLDKLHAELRKVNQKLEKYAHVNKKAAVQYEANREQRTQLEKKKTELEESAGSIRDLITSLDKKKDEAINKTFRHVSAKFSEVWKELCPDGEGNLLMLTQNEGEQSEFTGVSMQVRFTSGTQMQQLQLLSGGQKTLAALALIFAIQRSDPAPFYLFDEIDANLDPEYRVAVANLVHKQSHREDNKAQFVVSTFWPQLVSVADKAYRVTFTHPVSTVAAVDTANALEFVRSTGALPRNE